MDLPNASISNEITQADCASHSSSTARGNVILKTSYLKWLMAWAGDDPDKKPAWEHRLGN